MEDDTVTMKDAAFMLDTDMEQDMKSYRDEITMYAVKYINRTPELYRETKGLNQSDLRDTCLAWAEQHDNDFGELFQTELEDVDWTKVARTI